MARWYGVRSGWGWAVVFTCGVVVTGCAAKGGLIGAIIAQKHSTGRVFVREVPSGMEAARAGVRVDDEVLLIDGRDVRLMTSEQVHEALSGPIGTQAALTLRRGESIVRVKVKRGIVGSGAKR